MKLIWCKLVEVAENGCTLSAKFHIFGAFAQLATSGKPDRMLADILDKLGALQRWPARLAWSQKA